MFFKKQTNLGKISPKLKVKHGPRQVVTEADKKTRGASAIAAPYFSHILRKVCFHAIPLNCSVATEELRIINIVL